MGGFFLEVCSPFFGWDRPGTCYWLGVWKGSGELGKEEGREGEGGVRAEKEGDWRGGGVSVSGRARGLRGSTAFSACKVCRPPLRSALCCLCVSTRLPQLEHKETESERPLQS
ncbi:hypothetical protein NQZ68_008256 [Dissostichus eleginoides]|nr:hypothetical protein NQZ68_008256 [Dissostichus eleginoides]